MMEISNTYTSQGLKLSVIPYITNQLVNPQLWNSNFCPISLFKINEYLEGNTKNTICLPLKIVAFIN